LGVGVPFSHHTIKAGTTGRLLLLFLADAASGAGRVGLRHDSAGATAAFVREGEDRAHRIDLIEGTLGHHRPGAFVEVDSDLLPGVYQLGCPDEVLAPGATRALLMLSFPKVRGEPVEVALVAYDPQDSERIGVEGLADSRRHEFLRRALPRLTEMELAAGEEGERTLAIRLGEKAPD
jgi:hypothetical protein